MNYTIRSIDSANECSARERSFKMAQELDMGMRCIKYMLLSVTALFVLTAALIISIGTTIYAIYEDVSFVLEDHFFTPATFVIVIGVIMLFVSLFGCIGALKESTCLVNMFAVILSLVLILEISAAIVAYSRRAQLADMLDERLRETMPQYYEDPMVAEYFDFMQERMTCCGIDSYTDWGAVTTTLPEQGININNVTVPDSCCAHTRSVIVNEMRTEECIEVYSNGCLPRLYYFLYQSAGILGAGALTIASIQIIGILFSFSLAGAIRKAKSHREFRRISIREPFVKGNTGLKPDSKMNSKVYMPFYGQTLA